jgi:hypothetical protein
MATSGFSYKPLKNITIGEPGGSQQTSFGEIRVESLTPSAQADFVYTINEKVVTPIRYAGGGVYQQDGYAVITSSTNANGSGGVQIRRGLKYSAGQGSLFRGTALFDTPVDGNVQLIGLGNGECGYFFGYLNQNFAILHQDTSKREIRKLTVGTGAGTEDVTVTLDGDSIVVPVTGGGDTTQTAYQLSLADYSQVGDGWQVDVIGSDVFFLSARAGPYGGSYSAVGAGVGSLGSFSQVSEGVAPASDVYLQSAWNYDKMDGSGPSGMVLNPQRGNVFQIGFQYLGQGNAFFSIENENTGQMALVHQIKNANNRTTPVLRNPNVAGLATSTNTTATTSVAVRCASLATFTEGEFVTLDPKFAHVRTFDSADTSGVFKGLIALKVNRVFHNQACFGELDVLSISATNAAGSATPKPFTIGIFRGVEITGDVNFIEVNGGSSTVSYADLGTSGGNGLAISQNEPLFTFGVNGGGSNTIDLTGLEILSTAGEVLVIGFRADAAVSDNSVSVNWFEQQ